MDFISNSKDAKKTDVQEKILFLSNNEACVNLYEWLQKKEGDVSLVEEPITKELIQLWQPAWIISFNYAHIIAADVIEMMRGRIINLHISLLPYNRGASPNFFSFIDDTPKGVTIHLMDEGLDTGDILCQKELEFNENEETFAHTYQVLLQEMEQLFKENWDAIKAQKLLPQKQDNQKATYHTRKELQRFQALVPFTWNESIKDIKEKWKKMETGGGRCSNPPS